jgi:predicted metalloprotease
MFWRKQKESGNVDDQRSFAGRSLGIGGLLVGAFVVYLMGGNPVPYLPLNGANVATTKSAPVDSAQRVSAFRTGYEGGKISSCTT